MTAGTLGAIAFDKTSGHPVMLSNNHVLANENAAQVGDAVLQAGHYDGGQTPADNVAKLSKWIAMVSGQPNTIDAATAELDIALELNERAIRASGRLPAAAATRTSWGFRLQRSDARPA